MPFPTCQNYTIVPVSLFFLNKCIKYLRRLFGLTLRTPLTPASSKASRHAASSTVSSLSHPPCKYINTIKIQRIYFIYAYYHLQNHFISKSEQEELKKRLSTFGNTMSLRFGEDTINTSILFSLSTCWSLVFTSLYGIHLLYRCL